MMVSWFSGPKASALPSPLDVRGLTQPEPNWKYPVNADDWAERGRRMAPYAYLRAYDLAVRNYENGACAYLTAYNEACEAF